MSLQSKDKFIIELLHRNLYIEIQKHFREMFLFLKILLKILWKHRVYAEFRSIRLKLCGNCAFPQNFHTKKLGKITVVYTVIKDVSFFWTVINSVSVFNSDQYLTLSWRWSLSYRNQPTDLLSKSMVDWFLCDKDPRHKRVKWIHEVLALKSHQKVSLSLHS